MLESFMGPDNFQKGIQEFLKTYAFKNAATADLWRALQVKIYALTCFCKDFKSTYYYCRLSPLNWILLESWILGQGKWASLF
jgi:hypothetical protein